MAAASYPSSLESESELISSLISSKKSSYSDSSGVSVLIPCFSRFFLAFAREARFWSCGELRQQFRLWACGVRARRARSLHARTPALYI